MRLQKGFATAAAAGGDVLVGTGVVECCMGMDRDKMGICDVIWRYLLGFKS